MIKVHGGTPNHSQSSMCLSCRNATVTKGLTHTHIYCGALYKMVTQIQPVLQCSSYDDRSQPSMSHMLSIAWKLEPNKKAGGALGFQPPKRRDYQPIFSPITGQEVD